MISEETEFSIEIGNPNLLTLIVKHNTVQKEIYKLEWYTGRFSSSIIRETFNSEIPDEKRRKEAEILLRNHVIENYHELIA